MSGWLARDARIEDADLADCAVSDEVKEVCLRRMAERAAMVMSICTLTRADLEGLHPLELLALRTARMGLDAPPAPSVDSKESAQLAAMIERAKGGQRGSE